MPKPAAKTETHEAYSPVDFRERIAALVGAGTAWREPGGSRATGGDRLPVSQAVAATMAFARRMVPGPNGELVPDPKDIGPDLAIAIATGNNHRRGQIIRLVVDAFKSDQSRSVRRNTEFMGYIVNAAFDVVVHQHYRPRLSAIRQQDWDQLLPCVCQVMSALAEDSLAEARRKWSAK